MKKIITTIIVIMILMFAEYRFIMTHLNPYQSDDGLFHIEFMGQVDTYY